MRRCESERGECPVGSIESHEISLRVRCCKAAPVLYRSKGLKLPQCSEALLKCRSPNPKTQTTLQPATGNKRATTNKRDKQTDNGDGDDEKTQTPAF